MIIILIYNILIYIILMILLPFIILFFVFNKKWRTGASQRLGIIKNQDIEKLRGKKVLWFHAASVGEVQAVIPVIKEIKKINPEYDIMATTTSLNGQMKITSETGLEINYTALFPLDINLITWNFLKKTNPFGIVVVETEIWPNLLYYAKKLNIPVIMVNGRLSNKSFKLYHAFGLFFKYILDKMVFFVMQSEKMKIRLESLGIKEEKITILSNTKYSAGITGIGTKKINMDKKGKKFIVAGSIRKGEEKLIIDAFKSVKSSENVLIIAPRHMERVKFIINLLKKGGVNYILWDEVEDYNIITNYEAVLINTIGDLPYLYDISDIAIIGGGFKKYGGHNPIEAAADGLPIIMGKYMYNFEDTADRLTSDGGAYRVESTPEDISSKLSILLKNEMLRQSMGDKNKAVVERFKGSALKTAKIVDRIISTYKIINENKKKFNAENVTLICDKEDVPHD